MLAASTVSVKEKAESKMTPFHELVRFLGEFSKDSILQMIHGVSRDIYDNQEQLIHLHSTPVGGYTLGVLARLAIARSTTHEKRVYSDFDLAQSSYLMSRVEEGLFRELEGIYGDDAKLIYVSNMARLQFPSQHPNDYDLARIICLYQTSRIPNPWKSTDIRGLFKSCFGLALEQFVVALTFLIMFLTQQSSFRFTKTDVQAAVPDQVKGAMVTLLNHLALREEEFRKKSGVITTDSTWRYIYERNPLHWYPLIRHDDDVYVCPDVLSVTALLHQLHLRLFVSIAASDKEQNFGQEFGFAFQNYVGDQLKYFSRQSAIVCPEFDIAPGSKSIDWIVIEDDSCTLIECKGGRDKLEGRVVYREDLETFLHKRKGIEFAIKQCQRTEEYIREEGKVGDVTVNISTFHYVVISHESPYLRPVIYPRLMRDAIDSLDRERMVHFLSLDQLDILVTLLPRHRLSHIIAVKESKPSMYEKDFRFFLPDQFPSATGTYNNTFLRNIVRTAVTDDDAIKGLFGGAAESDRDRQA